ncbi:MAG: glycerol dehydrogenase, partial [Pseudomonadales bacterium]|nr:glycerol dehydrogenase [Pseudomonadales bacterium]
VGLLVSKRGEQADGQRARARLKKAGLDTVTSIFGGECSLEEIEQRVDHLRDESVECLIAMGGGKCVDAGKSIAWRLGVPVVVVPTLASNDAPCSAVSVLYTPEGVNSGVEFFPENPAMVIVDTKTVADASERYLVAGMGDAMATWYEARVCLANPNARSVLGGRPTLAAGAIGEVCAGTLYEEGIAAARAVADGKVDESLEKVVEANTLLSGIGFESGGLAVAHAIAQSYTAVPVVHDNYLHGEMVAMGTLTQLVMASVEEAKRAATFFARVGLPITLEQISLGAKDQAALDTAVEVAMVFPMVHKMPMTVTADFMRESIMNADEIGRAVMKTEGDDAYRKLHQD